MTNARRFTADLINDPFFIGFDRMLDRMKDATPGQNNYPPYNIVKVDDDNYVIELALAGFNDEEIEIEVKDGVLSVEGRKDEETETKYLHKGISARHFRRTFNLADTIVVGGAEMNNGILTIELENVIPEEKKPRKIAISRAPELLKGQEKAI